ncbi:MAG TPA: tetratricopeptide repeat protein [Polyangiaceae bacterium]
MDVRCSRCGTDYEFDDTLISERGTTVKCTNCSYQFKIFPPKSSPAAPERWVVRTATGKELVFTSLRELQRGISEKKVGPNDLLSRGQQSPRPLGSIPELEPFFVSAQNAPSRGQGAAARTLHGVAPPPTGSPRPEKDDRPTNRGIGRQGATRGATPIAKIETTTVKIDPSPLSATLPMSNPVPPSGYSQRAAEPMILGAVAPTEPEPARPPPKPRAEPSPAPPAGAAARTDEPKPGAAAKAEPAAGSAGTTMPLGSRAPNSFDTTMPAATPPTVVETNPPPPGPAARPADLATSPSSAVTEPLAPRRAAPTAAEPRAAMQSQPGAFDVTLPVASQPRAASRPQPSSPLQPTPPPPISTRERLPSYDETPSPDGEPGRRARTRWIVGLVFLAVAGLLGLTVGRQYAARLTSKATPEGSARDERASRFLSEGTRLADLADYEAAQESLAKAHALADRDPAVLAALARLETLRADQSWLRLRLLDPTSEALVQATHRELGRRVGKARQAVDAAFAVAPEDSTVTRARVDALRLAGEEKRAREWIAPVAANASDPQNAYVLAALDLAEAAPAWAPVIDRLRIASVSEREGARARAALVYALVRAGRVAEAETELAKIAAAERPHPLLDELTGFVNRFKAPADAGLDAAAEKDAGAVALDPKQLPALDTSPAPPSDEKPVEKLATGDFRTRLTQAAKASSGGDLERARTLYQSVLDEQPGNTEALSGIADVARKRGDTATAQKMYAKVLEANPSYLPALMASADAKWDSGDRRGAIALYRRIVEQAGTSTDYGQRAQARIAQGEGEPTTASSGAPDAAAKPADAGAGTAP